MGRLMGIEPTTTRTTTEGSTTELQSPQSCFSSHDLFTILPGASSISGGGT